MSEITLKVYNIVYGDPDFPVEKSYYDPKKREEIIAAVSDETAKAYAQKVSGRNKRRIDVGPDRFATLTIDGDRCLGHDGNFRCVLLNEDKLKKGGLVLRLKDFKEIPI